MKIKGITLIELLVTVVLVAVVALFASPSFMEQIRREKIAAESSKFFTFLLTAQEYAISTGRPVIVLPVSYGVSLAGPNLDPADYDKDSDNNTYWRQPLYMAYLDDEFLTDPYHDIKDDPDRFESSFRKIKELDRTNIITILDAFAGLSKEDVQLELSVDDLLASDIHFKGIDGSFILFYPDSLVISPTFYLKSKDQKYYSMIGHCVQNEGAENSTQSKLKTPYILGMSRLNGVEKTELPEYCQWW